MNVRVLRRPLKAKIWGAKSLFFAVSLFVSIVVLPLVPFFPATLPSVFSVGASTPGVQFVAPAWVSENAGDSKLRILDVRINPFEYFTGHIPGAVHIADNTFRGPNGALPVQYWQPAKLQALFAEAGVTDDSKVLIYSDGRDFLGATMVAYLLERTGHSNVAILDSGFTGYKAAQLPVTKEFPKYTPGRFTVRDNASVRVSLDEVKSLIGKRGVTFIDPRPPDIFAGQQDIWIRNGHIPGAKNIPWVSFTLGEANFHQLKPLAEIQKILAERNVQKTDDIIVSLSNVNYIGTLF
jgi:thiosulfate/3-mercaptopyruvate sulfurtransferase